MSSTEPPQTSVSAEGSSSYFGSTLMDIESYFDLPPSDPKDSEAATATPATTTAESGQFRPLKTPTSSPMLNPVKPHLRQSSEMWGDDGGGDSTMEALAAATFPPTLAGLNTIDDPFASSGVAPLQISTNTYMGQLSPPDSSGSSPGKAPPPGDTSPLDGYIATTRTVHGQVTPPDDYTRSPGLPTHLPTSLVLPMRLVSPNGSPKSSPGMSNRLSASEESKSGMGMSYDTPSNSNNRSSAGSNKRRRSGSSAAPSNRKTRKSPSAEEDPEVQEAKRRRFLERNRVAASKCRQKKKAWMQDLEAEARDAQQISKQLKICVGMLKEEILQLKNELLKHNTCDCHPIRQYLSNEAARLADGARGRPTNSTSNVGFPTGSVPDSKIHPALHATQPEFDLGYIDSTIDGTG